MKNLTKKKTLLTAFAVSLLSFGAAAAFGIGDTKTAYAEDLARPMTYTETTAEQFYVYDGAGIRVDTSGIRFTSYVDADFHNTLTADGATVTYFATAKAVGGSVEQAKVIPFNKVLDENGNYALYTYINFDNVEANKTPEQVQAFYAQEFTTSTFAKVEKAGETIYYKAYFDGEISRCMRAVGNEAWLNWTQEDGYAQEDLTNYFTVGKRSNEITAYAFEDRVAFTMPEYTGTATEVDAYVGAEHHKATWNAEKAMFEIAGCTKVANYLSIFVDGKVYSTKMVAATELTKDTIANLKSAETGYYVLTEDVDMNSVEWRTDGKLFKGTLDGNGHTIKNFKPAGGFRNCGLVTTSVGAVIKNLNIHVKTNNWGSGVIGGVAGATTVENVNIVCDTLALGAYAVGGITSEVNGHLTVKNTTIIIKATSGESTHSGFIAGDTSHPSVPAGATGGNVILENVVCYCPTGQLTQPFVSANENYKALGTDSQAAVEGDDYIFCATQSDVMEAYKAGKVTEKFLTDVGVVVTYLDKENFDTLQTATTGYYILTEDIDMSQSEYKNWSPTATFSGTLDGNGHTISNFTASTSNYNKFFYWTGAGATIKDLDVHMTTNSIRGGLIGQVKGATTVENVNIVCDSLNVCYGGTIANVIQGELTVKDTNIIIKATTGTDTKSGFIAGGESNSHNVVVSNVVCYNPTSMATEPYVPNVTSNTLYTSIGTLGTHGAKAVKGEDYYLYQSTEALNAAAATLSDEFKALLKTYIEWTEPETPI